MLRFLLEALTIFSGAAFLFVKIWPSIQTGQNIHNRRIATCHNKYIRISVYFLQRQIALMFDVLRFEQSFQDY